MKIIKSIKTSTNILNCFTRDTAQLGVTEVSRNLGLSKSKVSRILSTLEQGGIVAKDKSTKKYHLGVKVLELADIFHGSSQWGTKAFPYLKKLRDKTDETVMVFVIDGDHRVCSEKIESTHELRPMLNIGGRYPLHAGSAGKLLLAYLSEEERKKILAKTGLPRLTVNTITKITALEKDLHQIQKQGYAISHEERMDFLSSISAPIRDHTGKVIAAVCLDGPTVRFTPYKIREFKNLIVATANQISTAIGFKPAKGL
jgi:DNA-binding IclR family transcriptional regulator